MSVYFMQCEETFRIKIGYSADPARRLDDISQGATRIRLLGAVPGGRDDEAELHERFQGDRVTHIAGREWFYPTPQLRAHALTACGTPAKTGQDVEAERELWNRARDHSDALRWRAFVKVTDIAAELGASGTDVLDALRT